MPRIVREEMIKTDLSVLLVIFAQAVMATTPAPPSMDEILAMTKLSIKSGIAGAIAIVAGLLICFSGKRFFKAFLSIVGFAAGMLAGFTGMAYILPYTSFSDPNLVTWIVAVILGLIGATICLYAWKIGVYVGAGLGGYALMAYILSLGVGRKIESEIGRHAAIAIGVGAGVIAAIFLEDLAIIAASAITGAVSVAIGVDCYLNLGLRTLLYEMAIHRSFIVTVDGPIYYMLAGTCALAVLGAVVQLLAPSKGFGRGD